MSLVDLDGDDTEFLTDVSVTMRRVLCGKAGRRSGGLAVQPLALMPCSQPACKKSPATCLVRCASVLKAMQAGLRIKE